jgi:plastocyanin
MTKRLLIALSVLALASFALAACGDDSSDSTATSSAAETSSTEAPAGGGETVDFEADPSGALAFTETEVTAKAGSDTIAFDNPSSEAHNVAIEDADGNVVAATDTISGDTTETTADLKPGTYTFFCEVDSHRQAGMEGTLTVK